MVQDYDHNDYVQSLEPSKEFFGDAIKMVQDFERNHYGHSLIFGDKLTFDELKPKTGFEFVDAIVVEKYQGENIAIYRPCVRVKLNVSKEITGDLLTKGLEDTFYFAKILKHEVMDSDDVNQHVEIRITFERKVNPTIVGSRFYDLIGGGKPQNQVITEGVCYSNSKVPDGLRDSLRKNIDKLAKETEIDYHPNSNDVVRDLVHPALYSYIKDVSELKSDGDKSPENKKSKVYVDEKKKFDFWRRPYEVSKFQWLRTPFTIYHQKENAPFTNISIILIKINFQSFIVILKNFLIYFCHFLKKFGVMLKRWSFGEMIVMMTMILETTDEMFSNSIKKTSSSKIKSCK